MAEKILVVQGGKLIDGTGRAPIENSVIVIQAGRFQAVGRSGEVSIPAGAEVIDVSGKTVLPGFIDGHGHLEDFHGELYLHLGITTCANIELYQDGPWTLAQKQGTALGKIRGPRIWMSGRAIGGVSTGHDAFGSRTARDNIIVTTPEEVRKAVQRKKELGCDILKVNEFLSLDLVKVARRRSASARACPSPPIAGTSSTPPKPASTPSSISGRSATAPFRTLRRGASSPRTGSAA